VRHIFVPRALYCDYGERPVAALRAFREQVKVRDKVPLNIVAETAELLETVVDRSCIVFRVIFTLRSQSDQADGAALKGY